MLNKCFNQKTVIYVNLDNMITSLVGNGSLTYFDFNQLFLEYINVLPLIFPDGKVLVKVIGDLQFNNLRSYSGIQELENCRLNLIDSYDLTDDNHSIHDFPLECKTNRDEKHKIKGILCETYDVDLKNICRWLNSVCLVSLTTVTLDFYTKGGLGSCVNRGRLCEVRFK